jgi:hypothetical protein
VTEDTTRSLPEFPNLHSALSHVSVVTALLATISAATFAVPLAQGFESRDLLPWSATWASREAALVLSVLATASFVVATVLLVYADASNVDALSREQREAFFKSVRDEAEEASHIESFRAATQRWYLRGQFFWLIGLPLLALTAASLVFAYVAWLATALAVAAAAAAADVFRRVAAGPARTIAGVMAVIALLFLVLTIFELS